LLKSIRRAATVAAEFEPLALVTFAGAREFFSGVTAHGIGMSKAEYYAFGVQKNF
jgi:hypothetical protein